MSSKHVFPCAAIALSFVIATHACCLPKQFEGLTGISTGMLVNGTGVGISALFKVAFDYGAQKTYAGGSGTANGAPFKEEVFSDYSTGKMYVVVNNKCQIVPLATKKDNNCIPPDAQKVMSSYFGMDKGTLAWDMFQVKWNNLNVLLSVTPDECVPVTERISLPSGFTDMSFMSLRSGISNATVFSIPTACKSFESTYPFVEYNQIEQLYLRNRHHSTLL